MPYTSSKLTTALKDCFQGNCQPRLVLCINPADEDISNSRTLEFGETAKKAVYQVHANVKHGKDSSMIDRRAEVEWHLQKQLKRQQEEVMCVHVAAHKLIDIL